MNIDNGLLLYMLLRNIEATPTNMLQQQGNDVNKSLLEHLPVDNDKKVDIYT